MPPTTTIQEKTGYRKSSLLYPITDALGELYCATVRQLNEWNRKRKATRDDIRAYNACINELILKKKYLTHRRFRFGAHIYGLTDAGVRLAEWRGMPGRKFEAKDLDHEYLLTEAIIQFRNFCEQHGFGFSFKREGLNHNRLINPDAQITITTPKKKFTILIEIERQSYGESYEKKVPKYHEFYGTEDAKQQFGTATFYVAFYTMTDRRRQTVLEKIAPEYPRKMFCVTHYNEELYPHPLPDLNKQIFKTPKDYKDTSYSLLDLFA